MARSPFQPACGVVDEAGHICKRQPGHVGCHEHYEHGLTTGWPNATGWFVAHSHDTDGPYWYLTRGTDHDERKFDERASAEAACEALNRRAEES